MAVEQPTHSRSLDETRVGLTRYDLVLAAIPLALLLSLLVHVVGGFGLQAAIVPALVVGPLAIVDAIFLHPPTGNGGAP